MLRKPGTLLALLAILILVFAVHLDYTPAPVNDHPADTAFSVGKAYEHLRHIAGRPHSIGTAEKEFVRGYILSQCVALGLDTFSQHAVSAVYGHTGVQAGEVTNIIGVYKGLDSVGGPGSAVLVMAHYDSQP